MSCSSRFSDLRKHGKTRGFGRDFPYRHETLQNLEAQPPDFRRGAPKLGEVRDKSPNRSWSLFVRDCPKTVHLSKHLSKKQRFVSYLCLSKKGFKISLVLSVAMTSVHTGPWPGWVQIFQGYMTKSPPKKLLCIFCDSRYFEDLHWNSRFSIARNGIRRVILSLPCQGRPRSGVRSF